MWKKIFLPRLINNDREERVQVSSKLLPSSNWDMFTQSSITRTSNVGHFRASTQTLFIFSSSHTLRTKHSNTQLIPSELFPLCSLHFKGNIFSLSAEFEKSEINEKRTPLKFWIINIFIGLLNSREQLQPGKSATVADDSQC